MPIALTLFKPSITKRLLAVMLLLVVGSVAGVMWVARDTIDADLVRNLNARVLEVSGGAASNLNARLLAVDAIVENAAAGDGRAGSLLIRQRLLRSPAIRSVVVLSWTEAFSPADRAPVKLTTADRRLLNSGQARLFNEEVQGASQALYLVRALTIGGTAAVVFCEISPEWLWKGIAPARSDTAVVVMDPSGLILQATAPIPDALLSQLRIESGSPQDSAVPVVRNWNSDAQGWLGAVARLELNGAQLIGNRWLVAGYAAIPPASPGLVALRRSLPAFALIGALAILLATLYLRACWEPVLAAVRNGLLALSEGRYQRIDPGSATDSPRQLATDFNRAIVQMQSRMQVLASLNAIDQLLMHAADLEPALDNVLQKICGVSKCHGATLTLLDPHAFGYARSYVVTASGSEQPVARISVDQSILHDLLPHEHGVAVTKYDLARHSFLEPLQSTGADCFWIWPVLSGGRPVAILSVGYQGATEVPPELAGFGHECAVRLGVALSNSARDEELYRQAHFDALTQLPNRLLFRDRLAQELASAVAGMQRSALLYVDLDHFKKVNDSMGHAAGDQVLQIVAQRLRTCVKDGDTVARLGGDEFTVILRSIGSPEAARLTSRRIIESLQQPVNIGGRDHYVCASVGVTMIPDDGNTIEELMRNADTAMYQAKEGGRSREMFYNRAMDGSSTSVSDTGLLRALRRQEFLLHYQPQYSLANGALIGVEALLRWQPPREALRYPAEIIQSAEHSGLIVDIGAWALETACRQYALWRKQGIAPPRMALNISVHQLRQSDFPLLVRHTLESFSLPPEILELELTETVFADSEARESLHALSAVGVRLALDDFGTGYSSLGYLREHPVQVIKIDRSFVEGVATNSTAATLAETIIAMAHALGKQVVAEGVENQEQLEFLRARRCDAAQGYYFARPMSVADVSDVLASRQPVELESLRAAG
jgi:diguanylate cyclase (GGDEF)-like protein